MLFYLAKRFLFGHTGNSWRSSTVWMSILGIAMACLFVLVSVGILAGFQKSYKNAILDFNAHVVISHERPIDTDEKNMIFAALDALQHQYPHTATPYLFFETLMPTSKGMKAVILKGVHFDSLQKMYPFRYKTYIEEGTSLVGKGIARLQSDVVQKKKLKILTLKDKKGNFATRYDWLSVQGEYESGLYHFDSQFVLMPLAELQKKYFYSDLVNGVEIRLDDVDQINEFVRELEKRLGFSYAITKWDQLNYSLLEALALERQTFFVIAALILLIACISIFGFNFLFFLQRKNEFRILSFLGMSEKQMKRLFSLLSLGVGMSATVIAALCAYLILKYLNQVGIALNPDVYFVDHVPVAFHWMWFVYFIFGAWLLCLLTSWMAGRVVLKRYLNS